MSQDGWDSMTESVDGASDVAVQEDDVFAVFKGRHFSRAISKTPSKRLSPLANPRRTRLDADGKPLGV